MFKIGVSGAAGQLGSEIKAIASNFTNCEFFFTDVKDLDICDQDALDLYIKSKGLTHFINCAAYTAVDKAEQEQDLAYKINELGVKNLASVCKKQNVLLIHVSTDYVFDGGANQPYKEDDLTNPQSIYGKSKLAGEQAALNSGVGGMIIRTSWLYSIYGNNFVKTMLNLAQQREKISVVFDQIGSPTNAADLAQAILFIISTSGLEPEKMEVFHYSNLGLCSWFDFAFEIFQYQKKRIEVLPVGSDQYPSIVKRPAYSVMSKEKISNRFGLKIPYWRLSLGQMLENLNQFNK